MNNNKDKKCEYLIEVIKDVLFEVVNNLKFRESSLNRLKTTLKLIFCFFEFSRNMKCKLALKSI